MFHMYKKIMRLKTLIYVLFSILVNRLKFFFLSIESKEFPHTRGVIKLYLSKKGSVCFGKGVVINSGKNMNPVGLGIQTIFLTLNDGVIKIGNNVGMSNVTIVARNRVIIEDNVMLGSGVIVYDNDFHALDYSKRLNDDNCINSKPVNISEGAFVGAGTFILKGVTIGKHSIIGAGSVVTHSVPDNQLWAGNPAKYIRDL